MQAYRCVLITAVVYSVVIGLIYVALSVLAILARSCSFDMGGHPFTYMIFILYFRVSECKAIINWSNLDIISSETAQIPDETAATFRTYIFAIVYLALYSALIFTALFSLCGINNSCLGRRSFPIFFAPWIFVCCSIVVMDVLATTYYILDSISTTSTNGLMELLEIRNPQVIGSVLEQLSAQWRFLPPIVMFLVTSKFFVFLIMDIVVITLIIKAGWSASTYHKYVDDTVRHYTANMARANPAFEDTQTEVVAQKQHNRQLEYMADQASIQEAPTRNEQLPETPDRYNDTSRNTNAFVYPDRIYNNRQQEEKQVQRPSSLALSSKLNDRPISQQFYQPSSDREIESRLSHFVASNGNDIRSTEPLKDENISERQQQQTRIRVLPAVAEINRRSSEVKQKPKVPPKPQNRVSMQPWNNAEERNNDRPESRNSGVKVDRTSSMNDPTLRGQLPWSYFKARDDVPKKAFTELDEDEELPAVPVPDYTLHFPKNRRPNMSDSDNENSWSRYDQRY